MANPYEFHEQHSFLPATGYRAKELGEPFYFTGKKCKRGHLSTRYASSGNCKECIELQRGKVMQNFKGKSSKRSHENQALAESAIAEGKTSYVSVSACPKGHFVRFATTNNCVECSNEQNAKRKNDLKWQRIKKVYGMSQEDVAKMLGAQKSLCAICKDAIHESHHIDHCHRTGVVRGLLCSRCNQGIGLFRERLDILEGAAKYLRDKNAN